MTNVRVAERAWSIALGAGIAAVLDPGKEQHVEIIVDGGPRIPPRVQDPNALGGRVACDTSPSGTIFRISLQAAEVGAAARMTNVPVSAVPPRATILYIEDSLANLDLVRATLKQHRHVRLLAAMRAASRIELAAEHHPDLVLLDIRLPDAALVPVNGGPS